MQLVCSTAKASPSNFFPILYPESFLLYKKAVHNGLSLEAYKPFDLQVRTYSVPLSSNVLTFV